MKNQLDLELKKLKDLDKILDGKPIAFVTYPPLDPIDIAALNSRGVKPGRYKRGVLMAFHSGFSVSHAQLSNRSELLFLDDSHLGGNDTVRITFDRNDENPKHQKCLKLTFYVHESLCHKNLEFGAFPPERELEHSQQKDDKFWDTIFCNAGIPHF